MDIAFFRLPKDCPPLLAQAGAGGSTARDLPFAAEDGVERGVFPESVFPAPPNEGVTGTGGGDVVLPLIDVSSGLYGT